MKAHSLDNLAKAHAGLSKTGDLEALAKEFGGYDRIPVDDSRYVEYARGDGEATAGVLNALQQRLKGSSTALHAYLAREHQAAALAAQMTANGLLVDTPLVEARARREADRLSEGSAALMSRLGLESFTKANGDEYVKPFSSKVGKQALADEFIKLGVDLPKADKGSPSTGKEALATVKELHHHDDQVMKLVEMVEYINGARSIYQTVKEFTCEDGKVHPEIDIFQSSGRWSTVNPPLTTVGKKAVSEREMFIAAPGNVLFAADFSQVDARAIAAHSQDENYLRLFEDPNSDLWRELAFDVFGTRDRRDEAKPLGHGWNYGMGVNKLALSARRPGEAPEVSRARAVKFDQAMKDNYPDLVHWKKKVVRLGEQGCMLDNGFGRPLRVDPKRAYTQAPAFIGQSTTADIMKQAMLRLTQRFPETVDMLRLQVHDELVMECPKDIAPEVREATVEAMTMEWSPPGARRKVQILATSTPFATTWAGVYVKE